MLGNLIKTDNRNSSLDISSNQQERLNIPKRHLPYTLDNDGKILRVLRQEHKF
jgi:hypothetical protein